MKEDIHLIFILIFLLIAIQSCNQNQEGQTSDLPKIQSTNQLQALDASDALKYKPLVLKGTEIAYKELTFESQEPKVAYHNGKPFSGASVYTLPNGQIYIYDNYVEGIKHGNYRLQKNGTDEEGNPNNTFEVGTFDKGKIHGLQLTYYDGPIGPLKKVSFYDHGKMDGQWSSYYRTGAQWTRRDFHDGVLNGKVLVWDEAGILGKEYTYKNGSMIEKNNHFENK